MQQAETQSEKPSQREDTRITAMAASWKQLLFQILQILISCRHINTKTPGPTPLPLVPITPLLTDIRSAVLKGESLSEKIELLDPVNLTLECTWTGNQNKPPNITGYWSKDGWEIPDSRVIVVLENEQYNLKRVFSIISEENLGTYSCMFGNEAKIDFIITAPQISEVRDKPIVSYVGDSVVMTCKMEESKPKPPTWNWYKHNGTDKEQILAAAAPQRYEIINNDWKTKLEVKNLSEADSGTYYCGAVYNISISMSHVELRVISFLEPLKPFLSILVEVVILVTAILLYERSRSKKNNTEENGTNTNQINTQPQGEDNGPEESSSMRQRKV
ncbi:embigin [Melanotaenia boesemani]|uniref:embigin n=1 Tax=Melanotaenia boesemani TaxID=1250792 RepID=UPI001C0542FA|nr:embigin [Melanotaenia boesemani]